MKHSKIFQRVSASYDLERMQQARLIYVGCGGSAAFIEDMARCGVGEHVLIDPDTVSAPNVATQQAYADDIGKPKVEVIAERLSRINPDARINIYQKRIEDIDDDEFNDIAFAPFILPDEDTDAQKPGITLLCGLTDNFYAQARVNRLALHFALPSLCAQMYQYGQAAEITFTYPGVTTTCHRCMLHSRYKAYLEDGYKNACTSAGSPVFATVRVNATCGMIALALLHHGTNQPVWGEMLSRIGNRTMEQIRMHPDAALAIFNRVFGKADSKRIFFDETVWRPMDPIKDCPDCGGKGNLLLAEAKFVDTGYKSRPVEFDENGLPYGTWK